MAERSVPPIGGTDDPWLDSDAAARYACVCSTTIVRAFRTRRCRAVRINSGRIWRARKSWIDTWLMSGSLDGQAERAEREVVR
jgi:hypothetical protein